MQDNKQLSYRFVVIAAAVCVTAVGLATAYPPPSPYYPDHHLPQTGPGGEGGAAAEVDVTGADGTAEGYAAAAAGTADDGGQQHDDHYAPQSYHFQYAVHDPVTGDVKSQNEVGDGRGTVRGTYSLVEPDGSTRVVEYTADDEHGFNAEVKRIAPQHKAAAAADDGHQFDVAGLHDVLSSLSAGRAVPDDHEDDHDDGAYHRQLQPAAPHHGQEQQ